MHRYSILTIQDNKGKDAVFTLGRHIHVGYLGAVHLFSLGLR